MPSSISLVSGIILTKIGLDNDWSELLVVGEILTVGSIVPATIGTEVVRHGMQLDASTRFGEAGFTLSAVGGSLFVLFTNLAKVDAGGMRDAVPALLTAAAGAQVVGEAVMVANAALSVAAVKDEVDRRSLPGRSPIAIRSLWLRPNEGGLLAGLSGTF